MLYKYLYINIVYKISQSIFRLNLVSNTNKIYSSFLEEYIKNIRARIWN